MKKLIFIMSIISFMFLSISMSLFAKDMTLDDIIKNFDNQSSYKKINEIEIKKLELGKRINYFEHWLKLNIDSNLKYAYLEKPYGDEEGEEWYQYHGILNYPGQGEISFSYQALYVGLAYEYTSYKIKRNGYKVGFSQSLNDFIYSPQVYRDDRLSLAQKNAEYSIKADRLEKVNKIIDLYIELKGNEKELEAEKNLKAQKDENLKMLQKQFEIGQVRKLDVDYASIEVSQEDIKIADLNQQVTQKKNELLQQVGIQNQDLNSINLKDIEEINLPDFVINDSELQAKNSEIELKNKDIKFLNRQNIPELVLGSSYDLEKEVWEIGVTIKTELLAIGFSNSDENVNLGKLEEAKQDLKKLQIQADEIKKNLVLKDQELKNQYDLLQKKYETAKTTKEIAVKKLEITKMMYQKGYIDTVEYLKELKDCSDADLQFEQVKNMLNGFKYRLLYLSK